MQVSPSTHVALVLRVLYRLRFLAEQVPFEVATFSYMSPLLNQILSKGGIGLTEEDDPLEQVALSLDLVKFHSAECKLQSVNPRYPSLICLFEVSQPAFPRKQTMENLIHVIRQQPKLVKDASSALIDIGQSVHSNVTPDELRVLTRGTLFQEVYVRNACLQTLQVRPHIMHGNIVIIIYA